MNSYSNTGRTALIRAVRERNNDLSFRQAEKVVNVVFKVMTQALKRGEVVDIPGGRLALRMRKGKKRAEVHRFRQVGTRYAMDKLVYYKGSRKVIKFLPDESLDLTPLPKVPPPLTAEQIQCLDLAEEILKQPVDRKTLELLQEYAEFPQAKLGALLRRLCMIRDKGLKIISLQQLTGTIHQHWWL